MKTVIYYISTSNYKMGFEHFRKNISNFLPDSEKTVVVMSDGLDEWNGKIEDGVLYKVYHIQHYPWPIITLFKMKLILDHWEKADYAFYFNGNLQYNPECKDNLLDLSKLNVSRHTFCNEGIPYDGSCFEDVSQLSLAYIGKPYAYIHGGFFGGAADIVRKMCEDVSYMVERDLLANIIPQWHDESYLNKWCVDNPALVAPKRKLFSYRDFTEDKPFAIIETIKKDRVYGKIETA